MFDEIDVIPTIPLYELLLGHLVLVDPLQGVIDLVVGEVEVVTVVLGCPHVRGCQLGPRLPLGLPDPLPGPVGGHPDQDKSITSASAMNILFWSISYNGDN